MKRLKWWMSRLDILITLLASGATIVALLAPQINPDQNWLYAFFALLFPWFYQTLLVIFAYWLIRLFLRKQGKKMVILFPLIVLVWGWMSPAKIYQFNFFAKADTDQPTMRLMSYNMHSLVAIWKDKQKEIQFQQFLTKNHPDIIFGQECTAYAAKYIANQLHYHYIQNNNKKPKTSFGTSIISKYPILDFGQHRFYKSGNSYSWADIEVHGRKMRFFSIHLQSNAISTVASKLAKDSNLKNKKTWGHLRRILALYRMTAKQRSEQATEIKQLAKSSPYPVFFSGDFNDPPLSNTYYILSENKIDTFRERGKGQGITYADVPPSLRIDYILTPNSFKVLNHHVLKVPFSDHYPIMADVAWLK